MTTQRTWRRLAAAACTLTSLALLLYTVGAPHLSIG
ncbi:hypothetical protein BKA14_008560 [Actinoplanes abujensis]|uniref:Uncharacterized protein n=1 Tax=Paractinoplanes abujensis TaxID=882441 RepID=A0A7W7D198_9ACTN|nr:hypothetical protein [Actinoplanes abujensis]